MVYSWPGKTKNMSCHAGGEPEPVVDWYLNDLDRPLRDNETYKVFKMGRNSELQVGTMTSILLDRNVTQRFPRIKYGNDHCKFMFWVQEKSSFYLAMFALGLV